MDTTASPWAELLQDARKNLRLSRAELARLSGVSTQTVKSYELGLRHPTRPMLRAILEALKLERGLRDVILQAAGFAPIGAEIGPAVQPGFHFAVEEAAEYMETLAWPAFVLDDLMQVVSANSMMQRLWGVDVERDYPDLAGRNMLLFATRPRFADRVLNWDELVSNGIAVYKGHHLGSETIEAPSTYFSNILQAMIQDDARYVTRFFALWPKVEPHGAKVRWGYPVVWGTEDGPQIRFQAIVTTCNEPKGLAFNDWVPTDAESWACMRAMLGQD